MTLTSTTTAPSAPLGRDETGALLGQTGPLKFDPLGMGGHPSRQIGHCRPSDQVSTEPGELQLGRQPPVSRTNLLGSYNYCSWPRIAPPGNAVVW
jgi:hypothetical protein